MTKHIIKIRPYRVFKKDGLHYVKINNKKVYIRHGNKSKILKHGDKQIVKVVVNNLLAQRRSRRRTVKPKPVLGITSTTKPATGSTASIAGAPNQIDPTKITASKATYDPIYANANKSQIADAPAEPKGPGGPTTQFTIQNDLTGLSSSMRDAFLLGAQNTAYGRQILGLPDISIPDDPRQAPQFPEDKCYYQMETWRIQYKNH